MAAPSDNAAISQPDSVRGGSSAQPTPANNVGGHPSGWAETGYSSKENNNGPEVAGAGYEGLGHKDALNARSTVYGFHGLEEQKGAAERNFQKRWQASADDKAPPMNVEDQPPTCANEDHSFMQHKPGASSTLPGWDTAKSVVESLTGKSGK